MNTYQASVFNTLINSDPEMQANTARATACKIELMTTEPESERNRSLRDEIARLEADTQRRVDAHEEAAKAAI
jgi:uncharacterized small protein (DUF1192 family)